MSDLVYVGNGVVMKRYDPSNPRHRAALLAALGVEREWFCDCQDGSYYGPCPPPEEGEWEHEHWRYRHALCGWAYIVMEADGETQ